MLTNLFYLTTIIFIWNELQWIYKPKEMAEDVKHFKMLGKLNKGRKWNNMTSEYKEQLKGKILMLPMAIWIFVGLFTVQWDAFLFIIILNFIIVAPISRITQFSPVYVVLHWINSLIGFAFGVYVIVNHYHLHLNFTKMVLGWIN